MVKQFFKFIVVLSLLWLFFSTLLTLHLLLYL